MFYGIVAWLDHEEVLQFAMSRYMCYITVNDHWMHMALSVVHTFEMVSLIS